MSILQSNLHCYKRKSTKEAEQVSHSTKCSRDKLFLKFLKIISSSLRDLSETLIIHVKKLIFTFMDFSFNEKMKSLAEDEFDCY